MSLLLLLSDAPARLYWIVQPAAIADPSAAQVVAGLDGSGAAAVDAGDEESPISSTTYTFTTPASGLTPGTSYEIAYVWYDGASYSNVAVGSFSTLTSFNPAWARNSNSVLTGIA